MTEKTRPRWLSVINFLLIKVAWVACVVGGTLPGALVIALMFGLCFYQGRWKRERRFVVGLALLGLTLDSIWMHLGILDFGSGALHLGNLALAPLWIILLWVAVGLSLFEALGFFVRRPVLGAVIVGAAAPLSYSTGEQFGAVVIPSTAMLMVIALVWVVVFGIVFELARRAQQTAEL
tara:strand:+ start:92 stop:625 length:534 start_codon:yes stop_codon:yes gene_type:complete